MVVIIGWRANDIKVYIQFLAQFVEMTDLEPEIEQSSAIEHSEIEGIDIYSESVENVKQRAPTRNKYKPIKFGSPQHIKRKSIQYILAIFILVLFFAIFFYLMAQFAASSDQQQTHSNQESSSLKIQPTQTSTHQVQSPQIAPQHEQIDPPATQITPQNREELSTSNLRPDSFQNPNPGSIKNDAVQGEEKQREKGKEGKGGKGQIYIRSRAQVLSIPNFDCKAQYFQTWSPSKMLSYMMKDKYKVTKVPYPQLVLVHDKNVESPQYHYPNLVTYFKEFPAETFIYVHSAPIYSVLLAGAASSESVYVVASPNYPDKYLLKTNFVMNNIRDKLLFEDLGKPLVSMDQVSYILTTSSEFAKAHIASKKIVLFVTEDCENPAPELIYEVTQEVECNPIQLIKNSSKVLKKGIYVAQRKQ